ncbi:MAG: hypothetical protein RI894_2455 [Bacteroidota bacterium]|jgi:hypothetical protein
MLKKHFSKTSLFFVFRAVFRAVICPVICTVLCSSVSVRLFAQAKNIETMRYSVYFESDKHALSAEAVRLLQNVATDCTLFSEPTIEIAAFADADGASDYNQRLSERRAKTVVDYLRKQGISSKELHAEARGEIEDSDENASDDEKQKKRRVDIFVRHLVAPLDASNSPLSVAFAKMNPENEQHFTQKSSEDIVLQGKNGTTVHIESGSLQFADGSFPTGEVKFTLREAYDYSSMMQNALSTTSDDKLLETGGMVYIAAEADGKPLEMAKGKTMSVAMPTINPDNKDMRLFYGETNPATKVVDWKPTKQLVKRRSRLAKRVRWSKIAEPKLSERVYTVIQAPVYAAAPRPPMPPRVAPNPALTKRPFVEKILESDAILTKRWRESETQKEAMYQKSCAKYSIDSAKYVQVFLPAYKKAVVDYEAELPKRATAYRRFVSYWARYEANKFLIDQMRWVEPFSPRNATGYGGWYETGSDPSFLGRLTSSKELTVEYDFYKLNRSNLARFFGVPEPNLDTMIAYKAKDCDHLADVYDKDIDKIKAIEGSYPYLVALEGRKLAKARGLDSLFSKMSAFVSKQRANRATNYYANYYASEDPALSKTYTNAMEASRFGWINCDRFYTDNSPKTQLRIHDESDPSKVKMFAVFKDIKSIMPLSSNGSCFISGNIPIGRELTVIAFKVQGTGVLFAKALLKVAAIQPDQAIELNYKLVPMTEVKATLAALN